MPQILGKGELPDASGLWKSGRHYIFKVNPNGGTVECEDIFIAASLLCHGYKYVDRKIVQDYTPGKFAGTLLGKVRGTGERIFVFIIQGDVGELFERKNLFHCGAHLVDPMELRKARSLLMDALADAKQKAEIMETGRG
jgi:hypothetical protein